MAYSWKRNLYILWLGSFFVSMAFSVSVPFLPILLQDELGVNDNLETWTGIVFAAAFLGSALIAPFWGSMADKYGRKPMMLRASLCLSLSYFMYFFVQNPYELVLVRIVEGLLAGYIPSAIALVATNTPEKHVGYALGVMSTANATGAIIGPLIGGTVSHWFGIRDSFLVSAVLVFIGFIVALVLVKDHNFVRTSAKRSSVANDIKEAMANRNLMLILVLVLITTTSVMIVEPLLTVYVIQLGSSKDYASLYSGIIFSAVGIATLIAAPRWGRIGTKIGYGKVLYIGLLGGGIGNLLQIVFHHLIGFGSLRFIYGLFFAAVYPALNASIAKNTEPAFRGRAFSLNQTFHQLGIMLGPVLGGFLANQLSIPIVFLINGILLLLIAMLIRTPRYSFYEDKKTAFAETPQ